MGGLGGTGRLVQRLRKRMAVQTRHEDGMQEGAAICQHQRDAGNVVYGHDMALWSQDGNV